MSTEKAHSVSVRFKKYKRCVFLYILQNRRKIILELKGGIAILFLKFYIMPGGVIGNTLDSGSRKSRFKS